MNISLPKFLTKFFWGDDLSQLNWQKHQDYIIQTLLEKGDRQATKWLLGKTDKKNLKKKLPSLKLSSKSNNFWSIYLS